jgi:hypothetical protein
MEKDLAAITEIKAKLGSLEEHLEVQRSIFS